MGSRSGSVSTFTIIKGSMIEETYTVFADWDLAASTEVNLRLMRETNRIGAKSLGWLAQVHRVLRRRFDPEGRDRALIDLARAGCPLEVWKPILLWHMTRDEFLVRDFLIHWLFPRYQEGVLRVRSPDLQDYLGHLPGRGLIPRAWSPSTSRRVACGLLRIASDFGLMRGSLVHEFTSYHLLDLSFLYILHAMAEITPGAQAVLHSPDWKMFRMQPEDVEREIFRLHQYRKVHYEVAGTLGQLSLPCRTAADFAREMVA